jgi:CubicO group peptidase (beta-lactamase class C family)
MNSLISSFMRDWSIPGLCIAVVHRGEVVRTLGVGLAHIERNELATTSTRFGIASVTKPFVSQAVKLLESDGVLSRKDRIDLHLTQLPDLWRSVTVEQLVSHTSLIADYFDHIPQAYSSPLSIAERLHVMAKVPLLSSVSYSNTNFLLLGELIGHTSGLTWDQFLAKRVFEPLQMSRTRLFDPRAPDRATGYARTFRWLRWKYETELEMVPNHVASMSPDGGLYSTAADLGVWLRSISHDAGTLGWMEEKVADRSVLWHSGGDPGFSAMVVRVPHVGAGCAICVNLTADAEGKMHQDMFVLALKAMHSSSQQEKEV